MNVSQISHKKLPYERLDFLNFQIRLVHFLGLEPDLNGGSEPLLSCSLKHVFFHERPTYDALSYCWGDPKVTKPILVDAYIV